MHIICDCSECGLPADVEDAGLIESTDGDVHHVKTMCPAGHWFFMPADMLEGATVFFDEEID